MNNHLDNKQQAFIPREIVEKMNDKKRTGKAIILFGARQTGKTTLMKKLFGGRDDVFWMNGDEPDAHAILSDITSPQLRTMLTGYSTLVIDEAQRIKDIGLILKRITDSLPWIQAAVTGSSSFELGNKLNEPLTGRKWEYQLFSLSFSELAAYANPIEEKRLLHHRMLFGSYPEIVTASGNERELLHLLADSYLYKDILMLEGINKPEKLIRLLQAIAYQIGSQVSYSELSRMTGLNHETVEKYIQILEKAFIIFRLGSYSRNLRRELKKSRKIYFLDTGIRNAVIADFSPIGGRKDAGALWENYLISERRKYLQNRGWHRNCFFWRTIDQQEIDYLEEYDGKIRAYEFKWNPRKNSTAPKTFMQGYDDASYSVITPENYVTFLL